MRVVYIDETGISARENVTVVAGIILNPDKQCRLLYNDIEELKKRVPEQFREDFIFHATDLEFGGKYREIWSDNDRWELLNDLISLPRKHYIPLVVGYWHKSPDQTSSKSASDSNIFHSLAYMLCLKSANEFMIHHADYDEVAMIVAEQRKEARKALEAAHRLASNNQLIEKWLMHDEKCRDFLIDKLPITRVKVPPAFAEKQDEPILQIADACAFAFKRYINGASRSSDRIKAMLGDYYKYKRLKFTLQYSNSAFFCWKNETYLNASGRFLPTFECSV